MLFLVLLAGLGCKGDANRIKIGDNYSICPPEGWEAREFPGLKYDCIVGPTEDGFTANINFADEKTDMDLEDYTDLCITQMEKLFEDFELIERMPFETDSGIKGECIIINNTQYNRYLTQMFYVLSAKNNIYVSITCTLLDEDSERYLPLFEECVKTFKIK
jgi:hypothetical protein